MKKNILPIIISLLAIVTIVSFTIAGIMTFSSPNWLDKIKQIGDTQTVDINDKKSVDIENTMNIDIQGVYSDIVINKTTGSKVEATYTGKSSSFFRKGNTPQLIVTNTNSIIKIVVDDEDDKFNFGRNWFSNTHTTLEVMIPESYQGSISVYNVSGNANITGLTLDRLEAKTVSGEITIDDTPTKTLIINTTSGTTTLKKCSGSITFGSVSGGLMASLAALTDKIALKTISGDINVTVPQDVSFHTNFHSVSGNYTPPINYTNGGQEIQVNTVSGNLNISIRND